MRRGKGAGSEEWLPLLVGVMGCGGSDIADQFSWRPGPEAWIPTCGLEFKFASMARQDDSVEIFSATLGKPFVAFSVGCLSLSPFVWTEDGDLRRYTDRNQYTPDWSSA